MVYNSTHKTLSKSIPIHKSGYQFIKFKITIHPDLKYIIF